MKSHERHSDNTGESSGTDISAKQKAYENSFYGDDIIDGCLIK